MSNVENWIKFYDIIYSSHVRDVNFYKKEAEKATEKILEIGVGTGRIYIPLLKRGLDVYGIDVSEEKINHPQHYNQGKFEVIDIIEDW
ncbi:MAG: methyltransferase domain-containing protein, partial [Promethearchaeota archaeon]